MAVSSIFSSDPWSDNETHVGLEWQNRSQTPYPGISNLDVFTYLLAGERMAIPTRCPWTITELMKQCWENQPDNRPSFAMMVKMLHDYVANERNFQ
ncbi:hepatocyte growth factor receptor-like, partial [Paramuricea clavata]